MNYKNVYNQLIEKRRSNPLPDNIYGEIHHIIPRSLGGDDSPENLIRLSAREHFIAHMLLAEIYKPETIEWYKMNHAFMCMRADNNFRDRYVGSRYYALKRSDFSKVMSWAQKGKKNSQYGTCWIKHMDLEEIKRIPKEDLQTWLDKGWEKGACFDFKAYKKDLIQKKNDKIQKYKAKKDKELRLAEYYTNLYQSFLDSDSSSLREFVRAGFYDKSHVSLIANFRKYIKNFNPIRSKPFVG